MSPNVNRLISDLTATEESRTAALTEIMELAHANACGAELIQPLLVVLDEGSPTCRQMASWSLGKLAQTGIGDISELEGLVRSLKDEDAEVRENAAWALGELAGQRIGQPEELSLLISLLDEDITTLRGMAAWALGRLAQRMTLVDKTSVAPLERLVSDKSLYVSKGAEFALQRVREKL